MSCALHAPSEGNPATWPSLRCRRRKQASGLAANAEGQRLAREAGIKASFPLVRQSPAESAGAILYRPATMRDMLAGVACSCAAGAAAENYSTDDGGQQLTLATHLARPRLDSNQYGIVVQNY